jgi:hypothetical protein
MTAVRTPAVTFAEDATPLPLGTDSIVRRGLIFRAGDYPDKQYSMTAAELVDAAKDFRPVPIDLSHTSTVLDGHLGSLFEVEAKGDELHGSVRMPRWLDSLLDAGRRKVSCYWDRETKRLQKLSIVPNPRIEDAVLMAAFANGEHTYQGTSVIQSLHDDAARAGAVCKASNSRKASQFHSSSELSAIQAIHDTAVAGGAQCSIIPERPRSLFGSAAPVPAKPVGSADGSGGGSAFATPRKRVPAADRAAQRIHDWLRKLDTSVCDPKSKAAKPQFYDHPKQLKSLKSMHDMVVEHGATCPGRAAMSLTPSKPSGKAGFMSKWKEKLIAGLMGNADKAVEFTDEEAVEAAVELSKPASPAPPSKPADDGSAAFADTPAGRAARAKFEKMEAEAEARATADRQAAEQAITSRAATFADTLTKGDVQRGIPACFTPYQAKAFQPFFERVARDDLNHADDKVTFSKSVPGPDGKPVATQVQGTRWDAMAAAFSTLQPHNLTVERFAPGGVLADDHQVFYNAPAQPPGAPGSQPNETPEQRGEREYRERYPVNGAKK